MSATYATASIAASSTPFPLETNFLAVATAAHSRGFHVCPVHPTEKRGVLPWQYSHPAKNLSEIIQLSKDYPHFNVGIVSRRGIGNLCFLDIDGADTLEQIERETGHEIPKTLVVQSRPQSAPFKRHFYFRQTPFSFATFTREITGIKDLSKADPEGKYLNRYDFKGIGGGGYVVAPGSMRANGEVYAYEHDIPSTEIAELPDWLVTWIREDVHKYRSESAKLREAEKKKHQEAMKVVANGGPLPEYTKEEINIALWSRAISYAPLGTRREHIEMLLRAQMEDFMQNGKKLAVEWKDRIHKIAYDPNLRIGNLKKAFLGKLKRPTSIKPEKPVVTLVPGSEQEDIVVSPLIQRHEVMAAEIAAFPASLPAREVYVRLGKAVESAGLTLNPDSNADRQSVGRLMRKAGYRCRNIGGRQRWRRSAKTSALARAEEGG